MPYVSDRQRRFFHTDAALRAGITPAMVREFDDASKGEDLPERAEKRSASYGVPKAPTLPKPPTLGTSNTLGVRPGANYRRVPPIGKSPTQHKPVADLSSRASARSSKTAARGSAEKLNGPTGPTGS